MDDDTKNDENFFENHKLEVVQGEVEIGQSYPIYGMITKIINDVPGSVVVELNYSIHANLSVNDVDKIKILQERAFEPGIFVGTVISKEPNVLLDCATVIFGRKQTNVVQ